jgi:SAM-dependent methyltransferase
MDHRDHVELIRRGVPAQGGTWADLGAGRGAFTLALADLLGPGATIHAIDRDRRALVDLAAAMQKLFPAVVAQPHAADFTRSDEPGLASLVGLDGIVMANSLHFVHDARAELPGIVARLRPGGTFLLVEYDADSGNAWVPYPISFGSWQRLAPDVGLSVPRLVGRVPSRFLGAMYAAASIREADRRDT